MKPLPYIDRLSKEVGYEKVYGGDALDFLYGDSLFSRWVGRPCAHIVSRMDLFSALYGKLQCLPSSTRKIEPFIEAYDIDPSEFALPVSAFTSFNDFFIRRLKTACRPLAKDNHAVLPADARYRFFPDLSTVDGFFVKGQRFCLGKFLGDEELAHTYHDGVMVMARLCPSDYHRFHFPCSGIPSKPHLINGYLYSVNPMALSRNIHIFVENKRMITRIDTTHYGEMLMVEIGATAVGSINQTYGPDSPVHKGDEKGYFSFGGSFLVLLFQRGRLSLAPDLLELSQQPLEIRGLLGQPLSHR